MLGTDNLKKVLLLLIKTGQKYESVSNEKPMQILFELWPQLAEIPGMWQSKDDIAKEIADLTAEETADVVAYIEANLTLQNKKTEEIIETAAKAISSVFMTYNAVMALVEKVKGTAPATA